MTPETRFKTQVEKYLTSVGAYYVKQVGSAFSKSGVPDLLVCYKGFFIALELKAGKNKASELQMYHLSEINKAGGIGIVLYDTELSMLKTIFTQLKQGGN